MRVLPAILADARHVALDVARVQLARVERWREEQDQPVAAANEELLNGGHRAGCPRRIGCARDDAPRLGDRVDAALAVDAGAERRPVVEERPAVPVAIPAMALERPSERLHVAPPALEMGSVAASLGDRHER